MTKEWEDRKKELTVSEGHKDEITFRKELNDYDEESGKQAEGLVGH